MALLTEELLLLRAQSYYDDDIYYDASKDTKPKQVKAQEAAACIRGLLLPE